jgi:hypothetical protein
MDVDKVPKIQKCVSILWPSFLVAGVATALFFTVFDPKVLLIDKPWGDISRMGAYTIGFFIFWLLTASSCMLTCYFLRPCDRIK